MESLSSREKSIINLIKKTDNLSVSDIYSAFGGDSGDIALITLKRDLSRLVEKSILARVGKGRAVTYSLSPGYSFICPVDVEDYFSILVDKRDGQKFFSYAFFEQDFPVFSTKELSFLEELTLRYRENKKKLSSTLLQKEMERITIEFSWKSSHIEGNTYSLLETEALIKENKGAQGHSEAEKIMILNHKKALDYIFSNPLKFDSISIRGIEDVHSLLVSGLDVPAGLRSAPVGIIGTLYAPIGNIYQIQEAMETMCKYINGKKSVFEKALLLSLFVSYIQPFEDGNKRTSRLLGNSVLVASDSCPLSYRSVDEAEYKKALILFYEQNNISYFKEIFIEQFLFAVDTYFKGN